MKLEVSERRESCLHTHYSGGEGRALGVNYNRNQEIGVSE